MFYKRFKKSLKVPLKVTYTVRSLIRDRVQRTSIIRHFQAFWCFRFCSQLYFGKSGKVDIHSARTPLPPCPFSSTISKPSSPLRVDVLCTQSLMLSLKCYHQSRGEVEWRSSIYISDSCNFWNMTVGMRLSKAAIRYNQQLQKLRIKMIYLHTTWIFQSKGNLL